MSFSTISLNQTRHILGHIVDLSKLAEESEESNDDEGYESVEGADRILGKRLLTQARTFRDLENLFIALDALERWRDALEKMDELVSSFLLIYTDTKNECFF